MRKTFAAGAAKSWTGCPTRVDPRQPACVPSSRRNTTIHAARCIKDRTIDYLDQAIIDYRDHSHTELIEKGSPRTGYH